MTKINKAHLRKLKNAYTGRRLVPFIGAGLSIPFGMPGWDKLILDLREEFDYTLLEEISEEVVELLNNYKFLEAVDKIKDLGIAEEDIRYSISTAIKEKKESIKEKPDNLYKDLAKMNCTKYLTTNYDNYLSDYIGKRPQNIADLYDEFINEIDGKIYNNAVFNLHGDYETPTSIILSRESYDALYYKNQKFRKVLEHFREKYTLLFIGVSLEDEYIQEVLKASHDKLKARHFILLSNIRPEKQKLLEEEYNITILEYEAVDRNHTEGIRKILNEIMRVSDKLDDNVAVNKFNQENKLIADKSHSFVDMPSSENSLIFKEATTLPNSDSIIYKRIKKIIDKQNRGLINEAIEAYNEILQASIFKPLSDDEKILIIKGLLYCYITNRNYHKAKSTIDMALSFPKSKKEADLLSYIVDYYVNTNDLKSAYNIAESWYKEVDNDIYITLLWYYTKSMYMDLPFEDIFNYILTDELALRIKAENDNQEQFAYRLAGELAMMKNKFDHAIILLRKAYKVDDNVWNTEDLGLAYYSKSLEKADDGNIIKIDDINFNLLDKAVEYFEIRLIKTNNINNQGAYARIAIPYLRALFYLGNVKKFDEVYSSLVDYCQEDIYEISRMKAINNIRLNKFTEKDVDGLNSLDRALILSDHYNINGMYEYAISSLEVIMEDKELVNEDIYIQFLGTCLNGKNINKFNKYYEAYLEKWKKSKNIRLVNSLFYEINNQYVKAETELKRFISEEPSMRNYQLIISFYIRNEQIDSISKVYEEIIINKQDIIDMDISGFYMSYHEHLLSIGNMKKVLWIYESVKNSVSNEVMKIMEVNLKMRLGDFSNLVDLSMELYSEGDGDIIHIYNMAVAYLFHNDFEKSRYYINLYKSKGYVDNKSMESIDRLEDRLNRLENRISPDVFKGINYLEYPVNYLKSLNFNLEIPEDKPIVVGTTALYFLTVTKSIKILNKCPEVFIAFSTLEELHDAYCYCGDRQIMELIEFIKRSNNIKLKSPSFSSLLETREKYKYEYWGYYDSEKLAREMGYYLVNVM